ncbi:hypothetical protein MAM1_0202d07906 [Mucor ambiguus]|uniref:Uncharacterized protein n=1 Tax=Mucor ambiguus TaxID=91626 RepID=A0A0C9LWE7_9FUNG|nr:hypothetical protein MAM1_0202d07906 [Mucor ambiguus]
MLLAPSRLACGDIAFPALIHALAVMQTADQLNSSNYDHELPSLTTTSYIRLIPLLMASLLAVIALGITAFLLPGNIKKTLQQRALFWLTSLLCFLCATLTSIAFGITYHTYTTNITAACSSLDTESICSSYTLNTEIILLAISIGIFMISTMYSIICSASQLSRNSKLQHQQNMSSSYSVYTDYDSPNETPSVYGEKQDMSDTNLPQQQQLQRASLRPPPPNQQRVKSRSPEIIHNKLPAKPLATDLSADGVVPFSSAQHQNTTMGTTDIGSTSFTPMVLDSVVLRPPTLPFASRANNQGKDRPSSYGSNNTFGALGANSGPNSPAADDASSQVSSYMDYHQRTNSGSSVTNAATTNMVYASGSGTPSNHTLGGSFQLNSLTKQSSSHHNYYYYNSSEDDSLHHNKRHFENSSNSSFHSGSHANTHHRSDTLSTQHLDNTLFQRIDDYLHVGPEKH